MKRSGFTLVEMLIVSVMASVMALAFAAVMHMGTRTWQSRENQMVLSMELRRGIQSMVRELAQTNTTQLEVPGVGAMPANNTFYNSVRFRIPEDTDGNGSVLDGAGSVEWSANQITYALGGVDGRQIQRTEGGAVTVLANRVTAVQFRRLTATPQILELTMTVQHGNSTGGYLQQANHTTRIRMRN